MEYEGDIAIIQQRLAQTSDLYRRRLAMLEAIEVRPAERVLEVGCGGGALLPALACSVGATGKVVGIDISRDQITAANKACAGMPAASAEVQDVNALPYESGSFDVVVAVQVIEYLDDPVRALTELRRVCSGAGRLAVLATNWDTMFWNCDAPELTARMVTAWREHAPYPNLPSQLRSQLVEAGFRMVRQTPVTIINNAYHEDAFAYWIARLMSAFAMARGLVSKHDTSRWLQELDQAESAGTFFFSSTPVLTLAVASREG